MGWFLDLVYGGKPTSWTAAQWQTFGDQYANMANGVFKWTDFIPPTNLVSVASKMITLSLKALISGGNRTLFAGYVDFLNRQYLEGARTSEILFVYSHKFNAVGYSNEQVQIIALALHDRVFPGVRKD